MSLGMTICESVKDYKKSYHSGYSHICNKRNLFVDNHLNILIPE